MILSSTLSYINLQVLIQILSITDPHLLQFSPATWCPAIHHHPPIHISSQMHMYPYLLVLFASKHRSKKFPPPKIMYTRRIFPLGSNLRTKIMTYKKKGTAAVRFFVVAEACSRQSASARGPSTEQSQVKVVCYRKVTRTEEKSIQHPAINRTTRSTTLCLYCATTSAMTTLAHTQKRYSDNTYSSSSSIYLLFLLHVSHTLHRPVAIAESIHAEIHATESWWCKSRAHLLLLGLVRGLPTEVIVRVVICIPVETGLHARIIVPHGRLRSRQHSLLVLHLLHRHRWK